MRHFTHLIYSCSCLINCVNCSDDDGVPGIDKEEVKRIAQEMLAKKQKQEQDRKSRVVTEDELR